MADIKIGIEANAKLDGIDITVNSLNTLAKRITVADAEIKKASSDLARLEADLAKTTVGTKEYIAALEAKEAVEKRQKDYREKLIKSTDEYNTRLKREIQSLIKGSSSLKDYEKAMALLVKQQDLFNNMGGISKNTVIKEQAEELEGIIIGMKESSAEAAKVAAEAAAEAEKLARIRSATAGLDAELDYYETMGDQLSALTAKVKAYDNAVRTSIEVKGKDSQETQELMLAYQQAAWELDQYNQRAAGIESAFKEQERQAQAWEELSASIAKAKQQAEDWNMAMAKADLTGDEVKKLRMEYQQLDAQLEEVIRTQGAASSSARELGSQMQDLQKRMQKAGKVDLATRMKNLAASFVSAQAAIWLVRSALRGVINTIRDSAQAASEAEETFNLFVTTFEGVESTAIKTANTMASTFGMATSTAQKALGTFGDLAAGYGATDKEALAFAETAAKTTLDIVSFKNVTGDMDEIFSNIASGLAGNVENFRRLGYVITQAEVKTALQKKGLDKLTGSALQYAQIQERLNILIEKSDKAQGDMLKTLESTENINRQLSEAWKEYKENLGENVNPVFNRIKQWWTDILEETNRAKAAADAYANGRWSEANTNPTAEQQKQLGNAVQGRISARVQTGNITQPISYDALYGINGAQEQAIMMAGLFTDLKEIMIGYGATAQQVFDAVGDAVVRNYEFTLSDGTQQGLLAYLESWEAYRDSVVAVNKELEDNQNILISNAKEAISFADKLSEYNGVSVAAGHYAVANSTAEGAKGTVTADDGSFDSNAYNIALNQIANNYSAIMSEATRDMSKASWQEYVEAADVALGDADILAGLEAKLKEAKSMYKDMWNEVIKEGGDTSTNKNLQEQLALVQSLTEEIEAYNKELERKSKLDSAIASLNSTAADYRTNLATYGMDARALAEYNLGAQRDAGMALAGNDTAKQAEVMTSYESAFASMEAYFDHVDATALSDFIDDIEAEAGDYATAIADMSRSEEDAIKAEIAARKAVAEAQYGSSEELTAAFALLEEQALAQLEAEKKAEKEAERQEKYNTALESVTDSIESYQENLNSLGKSEREVAEAAIEQRKAELATLEMTEEEEAKLREEIERLTNITAEYYDALEEAERKAKVQDTITSITDSTASYLEDLATMGKSDYEIAVRAIDKQEEYLATLEMTSDEQKEAAESIALLRSATDQYYKALAEQQVKQEKQSIADSVQGYRNDIATMGMSDREKTFYGYDQQEAQLASSIFANNSAVDATYTYIDAVNEAATAMAPLRKAAEDYYNALDQQSRQEYLESSVKGQVANYQEMTATLGMSDQEKAERSNKQLTDQLVSLGYSVSLAEYWLGQLNSATATYYDALAKQNFDSFTTGLDEELLELQNSLAMVGLTEEEMIRIEMEQRLAAAEKIYGESDELTESFRKLTETSIALQKAQEFQTALGDINSVTSSNMDAIATFGMSDTERQLYSIQKAYDKAFKALDKGSENYLDNLDELNLAYKQAVDSTNQLSAMQQTEANTQSLKSSLEGALGEVGDVINLFGDGLTGIASAIEGAMSSNWITALIMLIIKLLAQTEFLIEAGSVLTDAIIPALDAFLRPMLPHLELLTELLQDLVMEALEPLFPVLKEIARITTLVTGLLNLCFAFITNSVKFVVGNITSWITDFINWIIEKLQSINIFGWRPFGGLSKIDNKMFKEWAQIDVFGEAVDDWNEMNDALKKIEEMSMEIADNTAEETDLSVYEEMYKNNIISAEEYSALVAKAIGSTSMGALEYKEVGDGQYVDYRSNSQGTQVTYTGGIQITINGSGLSEDELVKVCVRTMKEINTPGSVVQGWTV